MAHKINKIYFSICKSSEKQKKSKCIFLHDLCLTSVVIFLLIKVFWRIACTAMFLGWLFQVILGIISRQRAYLLYRDSGKRRSRLLHKKEGFENKHAYNWMILMWGVFTFKGTFLRDSSVFYGVFVSVMRSPQ